MRDTITIGITEPEKRFEKYRDWVIGGNKNIELLTLSCEKQNLDDVKRCRAILLTGGVDVMPGFYNSQRTLYPNMPVKGWNRERDLFEMKVFQLALENQLPILAICRGVQLVNVLLGGTLIPDLEEAGKQNHKRENDTDKIHSVAIVENTLLASLTKIPSGDVNSAHHQAIEQLGDSLKINCVSADGVIEGIEWEKPQDRSPLLGVQWHPERMLDKKTSAFSQNILDWFLTEAKK
jgi:putative glutamine amidotransferase